VEVTGRAFIEAAEWNQPQLSSLTKTPFRRLGRARKSIIFGRTVVHWANDQASKELANERSSKVLTVSGVRVEPMGGNQKS
jgi:hypothetical protein